MRKLFMIALGAAALLFSTVASAEEITASDAVTILVQSVVSLRSSGDAFCTGTYVGPSMVLTAKHCTGGLNEFTIEFDPTMESEWAKWVTSPAGKKSDNERSFDWALITTMTPFDDAAEAQLGCTEEIYLGQPVAFLGFSQGRLQFSKGYVTATVPANNGKNNYDFAVDLAAAPGASGSAIMSLDTGNIVGVLIEGVFESRAGTYMLGVQSIKDISACE